MACYSVELVDERTDPLMSSVPCAYILTMHETETFPWLHGVAARTYVQRNRGFRQCVKACGPRGPMGHSGPMGPVGPMNLSDRSGSDLGNPDRIDVTYKDLTHAYQSAFDHAYRTQSRDSPVLVFEDDARLAANAKADLAEVDVFVAQNDFDVYSLGSCGLMAPYEPSMQHWIFIGSFLALTHACVYSPRALSRILAVDACSSGHIDIGVLSRFHVNLTFYRPISYQPLRESENSKTGCLSCDGSVTDGIYRWLVRALIRAVRFDTRPAAALTAVYSLQRASLIAPLVAAIVFVVLFMAIC
jgi:hypothetical protein